jgi:hypothetical protein
MIDSEEIQVVLFGPENFPTFNASGNNMMQSPWRVYAGMAWHTEEHNICDRK